MSKPDSPSSTTEADLVLPPEQDPAYRRAIALLRKARAEDLLAAPARCPSRGRPRTRGLLPDAAPEGYDRARAWAVFQQKIGRSPPDPLPLPSAADRDAPGAKRSR